MSIAAGSKKRRNVQGHTVVANIELLAKFQRIPSTTLMNFFRQAREQGMAPIQLDDVPYTLIRHSDHTYTIEAQDARHHPTL